MSKRYPTILIILIILIGGTLRFFEIGQKTLWLDEAFSVWIANHNPPELWQWLVRIDQHPPLYYTLLYVWQSLFGDLQGTVRAMSALFSTAAIGFIYGGTRRLIGVWTGLIAAFILAISPFHVNFAQETRMYALLSMVVAAAYYYLSVVLTSPPDAEGNGTVPRWAWIGYAISQAAVMLTHNTALVYFTIAINLSIWISWLLMRRNQRKKKPSTLPALNAKNFGRRWVEIQGVVLLIWLPWAYAFVVQAIGVDRQFWLGPPNWGTLHNTLKNFNFSFIPGWFPMETAWMILYPLLMFFGIIYLRRSPSRIVLLLSLIFTPIIVSLLVSLRRPIYYDRTLIWSAMFYYVLMAAGIRQAGVTLNYWVKSKLLKATPADPSEAPKAPSLLSPLITVPVAILLLMVGINATALNGYYYWYDKEDWNKAADYVAANVSPGDTILFNATWVQIPFEYYYRHHDLDTPLRGAPADLFERGELEPRMMESDIPYLYDIANDQQRIWLVYSHDWYTDPTKIIPNVLNQMMVQVEEREFVGLKIMRFDRK